MNIHLDEVIAVRPGIELAILNFMRPLKVICLTITFLTSFNLMGQSLKIQKSSLNFFFNSHAHQIVLNGTPLNEGSPGLESIVRISLKQGENRSICTGVIVSPRYVMTSGHCLEKEYTNIQVQFLTLGPMTQVPALDFRKVYQGVSKDHPNTFVNDYLVYDQDLSRDFYRGIIDRRDWFNFPKFSHDMIDLALIRIEAIPKGYRPIEFYRGDIFFGDQVAVIGFGFKSREKNRNDFSPNFTFHNLIGFVQPRGDQNMGWQTFSPNQQNSCFGDSGGPLLKWNNDRNQWEIIGVNTFVTNNCANSSFSINLLNNDFQNLLMKWAKEMETVESL